MTVSAETLANIANSCETISAQIDFDVALDAFTAKCAAMIVTSDEKNCPNLIAHRDTAVTADGGKNFARVVRTETQKVSGEVTQRSAHGFVARVDGQNKKLGAYKIGDVFKADGWSGPARHARGNIFDENGGTGRTSAYGVS